MQQDLQVPDVTQFSTLQKERLAYVPPLPPVLSGGQVNADYGNATTAAADEGEIKKLFPKLYGQKFLNLSGGKRQKKKKSVLKIGVVLSGGQAAGGHNVIAGVYDYAKRLSPASIVYGFLKNLLYNDETDSAEIKLADFGLAKLWSAETLTLMHTACGTPGYVAPEVLMKNKGKAHGYDHAVDVWSTGVILYILLVGYPPFSEENTALLFQQIMEGKYEFHRPWWTPISEEAKDLVKRMMTVDPKKRITTEEAMNHPWLKNAKTEPLPEFIKTLKEYNAKRKLKRAVNVVKIIGAFNHHEDQPPAASQ